MNRLHKTYTVIAERRDGSTCTKVGLPFGLLGPTIDLLLDLPREETPRAITIQRTDPNVVACDRGPVLPMEEAIAWRQPDDMITRLLR